MDRGTWMGLVRFALVELVSLRFSIGHVHVYRQSAAIGDGSWLFYGDIKLIVKGFIGMI